MAGITTIIVNKSKIHLKDEVLRNGQDQLKVLIWLKYLFCTLGCPSTYLIDNYILQIPSNNCTIGYL
jgi:hypothetical protein